MVRGYVIVNGEFCLSQVISLRKCGISDNPADYCLVELVDGQKGVERELEPDETPYNIQSKGPILRLYIRCACCVYVHVHIHVHTCVCMCLVVDLHDCGECLTFNPILFLHPGICCCAGINKLR